MTIQGMQQLSLSTPEFDCLVSTPRSQSLSIAVKDYTQDQISMTFQGMEQFSFSTPEFDGRISTPRSQSLSIESLSIGGKDYCLD